MLTVTKVLLGVALAAVISPSVVLLAVNGVSTVVLGEADSVALAVDKVSEGTVVLVRCDFVSVKSGETEISGVDKVFSLVGL